ncbi:LOW QUALITY PROTEIN: nose resistant to fluoxetine protein 6-like [Pecten maximus]|uniref:LOW QUALITY PROTEIN: nose resistant to fluoxetine protein 6-like n=1 Tax=Pecten maximus TaxID=6579 RepID=UPI0014581A4C|nr:LOW QUALITY PROTEIN: nose resistant to fluoxetine protein 6-like [Pecten maximus]
MANVFEFAKRKHLTVQEKEAREELFYSIADSGLPQLLQKFQDALFTLDSEAARMYNVSDPCLRDTQQIILGIQRKEYWATRILDSLGKPGSGITDGNIQWIGSYDMCNGVSGTVYVDMVNNTGPQYTLQGKYCKGRLNLGIPNIGATTYGTCVPKTCSAKDADTLMNLALSLLSDKMHFYIVDCPTVETEYDARAIVSITICSIIGLLMILGTGYDAFIVRYIRQKRKIQQEKYNEMEKNKMDAEQYQSESSLNESTSLLKKIKQKPIVVGREEEGTVGKILMSFSVMTNGEKLLSTSQGEGSLTAINGMRFFSITWVILGHNFSSGLQFSVNSVPFYAEMFNRWTFQAIGNAFVSVDSFFTMSGLLLSYLFMKEMKKTGGKMNWVMFYFHRFWRLTPPYMLVLMVSATLTRYMGGDGGPNWVKNGIERDFCKETWWTNLLYINNIVKTDKMCIGWSWYLANDMQFFVISPLMLIPLYYKRNLGFIVCGVLLLATFITTGVLNSENGWPATPLEQRTSKDGGSSYMDGYYFKPWCRIGPYIVGIMGGYILQACNCRCKINKLVNLICWLVATVVGCLIVYGLYDSLTGTVLSTPVAAFYNTIHRSAWGICICWVIFACATGNGGFVNTLLSWKGLVPLSRLSYCAYLIHLIIISVRANSQHAPMYFSVFEEVSDIGISSIPCFVIITHVINVALFPRKRNHKFRHSDNFSSGLLTYTCLI